MVQETQEIITFCGNTMKQKKPKNINMFKPVGKFILVVF